MQQINNNQFYVYSYSSEKDGVFWVGKGKDNRIDQNHKECPYCYNVLQKRTREGIEIIKRKIYENMTERQAFDWEVYLIKFYNSKCNLTDGGQGISGYKYTKEQKEARSGPNHPNWGKHPSVATRKKMSKSQSGENNAMWGKTLSSEAKKKLSKAFSGKNNPMYGKKGKDNPSWGRIHTFAEREKISKALTGRFFSDEHKRRLSEAQIGEKNHNSKLTQKQADEIREKYIPLVHTMKMLAEEYGVTNGTIQAIIENRTWKKRNRE